MKIRKRKLIYLLIILLLLLAVTKALTSISKKSETESNLAKAEEYVYVCPMGYPEWSDKPGKSKFCGMDLIKKKKSEVPFLSGKTINEVRLSPSQMILADVAVQDVQRRLLSKEIYAVGRIFYNETKLAHVAAWVAGRVDKLFVNFTGEVVEKGQPLLLIYSPDLVTSQEEYLLALQTLEKVKEGNLQETIEDAKSLIESTKRRLLLWGIAEKQIEELEKTQKVQTHMTIYAPIGGTVIRKEVLEGKYVNQGDILYDIADLSAVWMLADIYEYELSWIKLGQVVEVTSDAFPGHSSVGRITFINPFLNPETRTIQIRAEFPNPDNKLKPDMYVKAKINVSLGNKLSIPASAVLNTGTKEIAWVEKEPGVFQPRVVKTGGRSGEYYVISEGLQEGEKVVTSAGFLLDSESQLMLGGAGETPAMPGESGELDMNDLDMQKLEQQKKEETSQHQH